MIAAVRDVSGARLRPSAAPLDVGRDEARERAVRELSSPAYQQEESSPVRRVLEWIWQRVLDLVDLAGSGTTGRIVIAVAGALLVAGIVLVVRRARPDTGRPTGDGSDIFGDTRLAAGQYRAAADAAVGSGDWRTAVIERFRAVAAELEERGVIEPRAARTAHEVARAAGAAVPEMRDDLAVAARLFDGVRYGGAQAGPEDHRVIEAADIALRRDGRSARRSVGAAGVEPPR